MARVRFIFSVGCPAAATCYTDALLRLARIRPCLILAAMIELTIHIGERSTTYSMIMTQ